MVLLDVSAVISARLLFRNQMRITRHLIVLTIFIPAGKGAR